MARMFCQNKKLKMGGGGVVQDLLHKFQKLTNQTFLLVNPLKIAVKHIVYLSWPLVSSNRTFNVHVVT